MNDKTKEPIELEILSNGVTEEEITSLEVEVRDKEKSSIDIKGVIKTLYRFSKRQDRSEAASEAIIFLGETAGIPFDIPIPVGYGFIAIINKSEGISDILYEKDSDNTEMINALQWLLYDGVCFKVTLKWEAIDVMKVFITINKNAIQVIKQLPETISFLESAASTTNKIVSKTNVTKIALRLFFKILKKDFEPYEDMSCFYSCVPDVVKRRIERKGAEVLVIEADSTRLCQINSFDNETTEIIVSSRNGEVVEDCIKDALITQEDNTNTDNQKDETLFFDEDVLRSVNNDDDDED